MNPDAVAILLALTVSMLLVPLGTAWCYERNKTRQAALRAARHAHPSTRNRYTACGARMGQQEHDVSKH